MLFLSINSMELNFLKRGCVPHLSKEVFKMLTSEQEFLMASLPSTIMMTEFVKQFKSLNEFVGMQVKL